MNPKVFPYSHSPQERDSQFLRYNPPTFSYCSKHPSAPFAASNVSFFSLGEHRYCRRQVESVLRVYRAWGDAKELLPVGLLVMIVLSSGWGLSADSRVRHLAVFIQPRFGCWLVSLASGLFA